MMLRHFTNIYNCLLHEVRGSGEDEQAWNNEDEGHARSFVGHIPLLLENKATTLKGNAVVAYPMHMVRLSCSIMFQR